MSKVRIGLLVAWALFLQVCGVMLGATLFATAITGIYCMLALKISFGVSPLSVWGVALVIGIAYSRRKYSMVWEPVDKNEKPPESN